MSPANPDWHREQVRVGPLEKGNPPQAGASHQRMPGEPQFNPSLSALQHEPEAISFRHQLDHIVNPKLPEHATLSPLGMTKRPIRGKGGLNVWGFAGVNATSRCRSFAWATPEPSTGSPLLPVAELPAAGNGSGQGGLA